MKGDVGRLLDKARRLRHDNVPFPELEALRHGLTPVPARLVERWFPHRQFLVRGAGSTIAVNLSPRLQIALASISAVSALGVLAALVGSAENQFSSVHLLREVDQLRVAARASADQATQYRERLQRLDAELSRDAIDRDRAAALVSADDRILADQRSDIDRLQTERDHILAERDKALAERDAAVTANVRTLLQLDAETQNTIAEVEGIITSTGLDLSRVLKVPAAADHAAPLGGPFVPWRGLGVPPRTSDSRPVRGVANGLERLQTLRDMLVHLPLASPVAEVEITNGFGYRLDPFTGFAALHEGVDLRSTRTSGVYATAAGVVSFAGWHPQYGNMVEIDHGFGLSTRYAHLSRVDVGKGEIVALHQPLGVAGATGRATGVHLHYEVRVDGKARNPVNFLKANRYVPEADRYVPEATISIPQEVVPTSVSGGSVDIDHQ